MTICCPCALRLGGRTLGGALSWATPQPLAPFGDDSLFAGLTRAAEVLVNKQVLADPAGLGPEVKVWARLKDGTPLVTAAKRGDGQLIFFHVTANSDWSNLPLSGLFVEMLRRIASLGGTGGGGRGAGRRRQGCSSDAPAAAEVLAPLQVLDGFGLLKNPPPTTQAIAAAKIADAKPSAENPPGYYGPAGAPRALNLMTPKSLLKPLPVDADGRRAPRLRGRHGPADQAAAARPSRWRCCSPTSSPCCCCRRAGSLFGAPRRRAGTAALVAVVAVGTRCRAAGLADAQAPPGPGAAPASRPRPTTRAPSRPPPRSPSATCCPATRPPTRRAARA